MPGESCSGCKSTTLTKTGVTQADAGWYSCTGTNSLGEGPPARAQLLIKRKLQCRLFLEWQRMKILLSASQLFSKKERANFLHAQLSLIGLFNVLFLLAN